MVIDKATGEKVRNGDRWLLRCGKCDHVAILDDHELREIQGRQPRGWILLAGGSTLGTVGMGLMQFAMPRSTTGPSVLNVGYLLLGFGAMAGFVLGFSLQHFGRARQKVEPGERINLIALGVFYFAVAVLIATLCVWMWLKEGKR